LLGVSLVPKTFTHYHFSANWGEALRYPDFNSLFWKGDVRAQGNPALLPERKKYWNTSLRYMPDNYFIPQVLIYFYVERLQDLIFWHRSAQGLWEPRNEARATKRGIDFQIDQSILRERIKLQIAYSYVEPINKTDEPTRKDKTIVYIPRNTLMSSFWFHTVSLQFMLSYRYVSERQITAANTGYPLSAYHLLDGLVSFNRKIFNLKLNCELAVKNITASSYELIRGYPMPARDIQFSLGLQYPWN
jgi:outer membrane cobalamin receptor